MTLGLESDSQRPALDTTRRRGGAWGTRGDRVPHLSGGLGANGLAIDAGSGPEVAKLGEPLLLDSLEVARLLGLGRTKVFQMMARSELPVVRIGRCVRVSRPALLAWIQERIVVRASDWQA